MRSRSMVMPSRVKEIRTVNPKYALHNKENNIKCFGRLLSP